MITPFGVDAGHEEGNYSIILDSARFGDILSSLWTVSIVGKSRMYGLEKTKFIKFAKTLGESYHECGLLPEGDRRGVIENRPAQFSSGIEVVICERSAGRRLSVNSCIGILSLRNVRESLVQVGH